MDQNKERERFRQAVERKKEHAREASHQSAGGEPVERGGDAAARIESENRKLIESDRQQDTLSVRAKNAGHGHKTADKWNQ